MGLTIKQKAFADYYIELGNASEAYKKAYENVKSDAAARANSSRLLNKQEVKEYIQNRLREIEDSRIADAAEVLKYLTSVMRGKETEQVVVVEGVGEGISSAKTISKEVSVKDRIKAAELLGKRYSLFTDKVDFDGDMQVQIVDDIQ